MDILSVLPVGYAPDAPASAPAADIERESPSEFDSLVSEAEDTAAPAPSRRDRPEPKDRPERKDRAETDAAPSSEQGSKDEPAKTKATDADPLKTSSDRPATSDQTAMAPATQEMSGDDAAPAAPTLGAAVLPAAAPSSTPTVFLADAAQPTAQQPSATAAPGQIVAPATPTAAPAMPAVAPAASAADAANAPEALTAASTPVAPSSAETAPAPVAPSAPTGQPAAAAIAPTAAQAAAAVSNQALEAAAQNPRADRDLAKTAKPSDGKNAARTTTADPAGSAGKPAAHGADAATVKTAATAERPIVTAQEQALPADAADAARLAGGGRTIDAADAGGLRRIETAHAAQAPERAGAPRGLQIDVAALATRFAARVQNGATKFQIRLDPPELGRVDVRLDVGDDGVARARLIAERPEALAELTRNARALERALADAGVDLSGGLSFELAGRREGGEAQERGYGPPDSHPVFASAEAAEPLAQAADALVEIDTAYGFSVLRRGRLDVRI